MSKRPRIVLLLVVSLCYTTPVTCAAQTAPPPLSELLPNLYRDHLLLNAVVVIIVFQNRIASDPEAFQTARLGPAAQIIRNARGQLSSFPLPSSAGGFTWTFDSASGAFNRGSSSFGPVYAERAFTIGGKHFNFGAAYQSVTFDHLDGKRLSGDEIATYTGVWLDDAHTLGIFVADRLNLDVSTNTTVTYATYGLTDRWDIGVAVPFNRVQVKARLTTRVGDTANGFLPDELTPDERSGSAQGVGDVVARTKFNFLKRHGGGLAAAVDFRLPTGDETNLLGVGSAQAKVYLVASTTRDKLSPHVNIGYTISGSSAAASSVETVTSPDEFNYTGGADIELSLRSTLAFDIVGRTLRKAGTLNLDPIFGSNYQQLALQAGKNLNLLLGSTGVKFTPFANMLITGNVLYPLSSSGLTDKLTWMFGVEYSF
jgi:hypothetical protein